MEWSHWNFPTQELVAITFDSFDDARKLLVDPDKQCIVYRGTTDEDEMYGWPKDDWQCEHTLDPRECVNCNPAYRHADWKWCNVCNANDMSDTTWHVDNVCLRCNPDYGKEKAA